ncbi:MAG: MarR family transcriptional regulator [[Clostridium] symbiosum]|nr:MarR family transcriptional regulator [[Clostridium] symbiosum]
MQRRDTPSHDFYIKNIAHLLRYKSDQRLAPYDITESQARLLGHIYGAQRSEQEISRRYLSQAMQISGPSVTSLLNNLEKKGLISRCSGSEDGRTMRIELSQKAIILLNEMSDILNMITQDLLVGFSEEEKIAFLMFLKRAYKNLGMDSHI